MNGMPLAAKPSPGTPTPATISRWADTHQYSVAALVWQAETGNITAKLSRPDHPDVFAKHCAEDPLDEAERLSWLHGRFPSPAIVDYAQYDDGYLLATLAMPGESAVSERWRREPRLAAAAVGEGLARLHSLDPSECLFDSPAWITDDIGDTVAILHGDPCAPNTLLGDDGTFAGIVDLPLLGPGDPWADLAIASWSLEWNFGPGFEAEFFAAYGVAPDEERCRHYRTMWE